MQQTRQAILDALADGPITGPTLAAQLGMSRAAIWKHVEALREAGFQIDSADGGYALQEVPESGAEALVYGLEAPFDIEHHETLPSTNARARDLADEGAEDVVVLAETQTGGRGRLDRDWSSPAGGVWCSICFRPTVPPTEAPIFTLAAAVAVTRACREAGADAEIKWPNDVLVDGHKIAGILTEMEGEADRVSWIVMGIGVNANVDVTDLPTEADATSLRDTVGDVDRRLFTQRLLEELHALRNNLDAVLPAWREAAATLGREVRVETPRETVTGTAVDVQYPGTLVVETDNGRVEVTTGDCEHLRPMQS